MWRAARRPGLRVDAETPIRVGWKLPPLAFDLRFIEEGGLRRRVRFLVDPGSRAIDALASIPWGKCLLPGCPWGVKLGA